MELSTGNAVGPDAWEIPVADLGYTWIAAPEGFVGSADLVAELRLPDNKIADRQGIEFKWGPPISPEPALRQLDRQQLVAGPLISPEPTQRQPDREEPKRKEPEPPISQVLPRQLDQEEIAVLLERAKDLIVNGDLVAARLLLQRAADANDAEATLALAATYDPYVLRKLKVYNLAADPEMARAWYEKARKLGSSAASRRLEMLTSGAR